MTELEISPPRSIRQGTRQKQIKCMDPCRDACAFRLQFPSAALHPEVTPDTFAMTFTKHSRLLSLLGCLTHFRGQDYRMDPILHFNKLYLSRYLDSALLGPLKPRNPPPPLFPPCAACHFQCSLQLAMGSCFETNVWGRLNNTSEHDEQVPWQHQPAATSRSEPTSFLPSLAEPIERCSSPSQSLLSNCSQWCSSLIGVCQTGYRRPRACRPICPDQKQDSFKPSNPISS